MPTSSDIRAGGAYVELFSKDNTTEGLSSAEQKYRDYGRRINQLQIQAAKAMEAGPSVQGAALQRAAEQVRAQMPAVVERRETLQ